MPDLDLSIALRHVGVVRPFLLDQAGELLLDALVELRKELPYDLVRRRQQTLPTRAPEVGLVPERTTAAADVQGVVSAELELGGRLMSRIEADDHDDAKEKAGKRGTNSHVSHDCNWCLL